MATVDFGTTGSTVTLRQRGDDRNAPHREWLATMAEGLGGSDRLGRRTDDGGTGYDGRRAGRAGPRHPARDRRERPARDVARQPGRRPGPRPVQAVGPRRGGRRARCGPAARRPAPPLPSSRSHAAVHPSTRSAPHRPRLLGSLHRRQCREGRVAGRTAGLALPRPPLRRRGAPATTATIRDLKRRFARSRDLGVDPRALLPELAHLGDGGQPAVEQVVAGVYDFLLDHAAYGPAARPTPRAGRPRSS